MLEYFDNSKKNMEIEFVYQDGEWVYSEFSILLFNTTATSANRQGTNIHGMGLLPDT